MKKVAIWALGLVLTGRALAWDPIGHMLVGQSAYGQLTPEAKAAVEKSLAEFNKKNHADYTFVTANCWMDDIRGTQKEYSPWHYIELPYTREGDPFPPTWKVNALWGINHCTAIIKGERTDEKVDKDQALVMLMHLVGDIHQPLHTVSRDGDRGGNKVVVPNLEDAKPVIYPNWQNLHYFWDSAYRRVVKDGKAVETFVELPSLPSNPAKGHAQSLPIVVEQSAVLEKGYLPEKYPSTGTPEEWVRESHTQGYDNVYQALPGGEATNPVTLDQPYVDNARALTQQKIVQGGHRLAALLNELYK